MPEPKENVNLREVAFLCWELKWGGWSSRRPRRQGYSALWWWLLCPALCNPTLLPFAPWKFKAMLFGGRLRGTAGPVGGSTEVSEKAIKIQEYSRNDRQEQALRPCVILRVGNLPTRQ